MEKLTWSGWSDCEIVCLMRHSALAHFALKSVSTGLELSFRKTVLFLVFQMLHRSDTILSNFKRGLDTLNLANQFYTLWWGSDGVLMVIQLWSFASLQTWLTMGHLRKRCSTSSISIRQWGHNRSICSPLLRRTPLVGSDAWHNCQRKIFNLGMTCRCPNPTTFPRRENLLSSTHEQAKLLT